MQVAQHADPRWCEYQRQGLSEYPSFLPRCCFHMPVGQKSQQSSHRFALQSAQALVLCRALLEKAAAN